MADIEINASDLPSMLQHWVEIIGLDAVLALVQRFGGVHVYIPKPQSLTREHWLAQAIGIDLATSLAREYASNTCLVPLAQTALRRLKEGLIRSDLGVGMSVRDIALKHRVHERRVWRIKAKAQRQDDAPDPQQTLF